MGQPARRVSFTPPKLRHLGRRFNGKTVVAVETRGKAMLTHFEHGLTIYSHNQLYGVWEIAEAGLIPPTGRSLRLAIHTAQHSALLYSASDISVWPRAELDEHPFLARLGPDVLSQDLDWQTIARRLMQPGFGGRTLGSVLLDQAFIAGLGNYLRSEILFAAALHPDARPIDLTRAQSGELARQILRLSLRSYRTGGVTNPPGREKALKRAGQTFEKRRFAVFGRDARPCYRCGTKVSRRDTNSRPFYYCPQCQKSPRDPRGRSLS